MTDEQIAQLHEGAGVGPYLHTAYVRHAFFDNGSYWLHSWYQEEHYAPDIDEEEFKTIDDLEKAMVAIAPLNQWDWGTE